MKPPTRILYVFPGQGSQYVGMGSDLYETFGCVRAIYECASDCLGFDVARLSFHGPEERLNRTEFTQIALLTHAVACLEAFSELTGGRWAPDVAAGHSLGEYAALVAAGALEFEDALQLVRWRGRLMSVYGRGRMAAFRLDLESIKPLADARYCGIGGCNLPDQTVVCGFESDLDALMDDVADKFGRSKAGRFLKTEGAFHTYLMIGAAERFRPHLDTVRVRPPRLRVLSNYTGEYHSGDPERIRAALFFQMFHPVKWIAGLQRGFADGARIVVELGGGIGAERPGVPPSPATRRPNLEGITRAALASACVEGIYLPAINLGTLQRTAEMLAVLDSATSTSQAGADDGGTWVDQRLHTLRLPLHHGLPGERALSLGLLVRELGLARVVRTTTEPERECLETLRAGDPAVGAPEPYLEVLVDGGTGAFLHYRGDDIRCELVALRERLAHPGYHPAAPQGESDHVTPTRTDTEDAAVRA